MNLISLLQHMMHTILPSWSMKSREAGTCHQIVNLITGHNVAKAKDRTSRENATGDVNLVTGQEGPAI